MLLVELRGGRSAPHGSWPTMQSDEKLDGESRSFLQRLMSKPIEGGY
jgi:hypothetical protein